MDADSQAQLYEGYERKFGEMPEDLQAPNWLFQPEFDSAMAAALRTGIPVTAAELERRMGPPFWEECKD